MDRSELSIRRTGFRRCAQQQQQDCEPPFWLASSSSPSSPAGRQAGTQIDDFVARLVWRLLRYELVASWLRHFCFGWRHWSAASRLGLAWPGLGCAYTLYKRIEEKDVMVSAAKAARRRRDNAHHTRIKRTRTRRKCEELKYILIFSPHFSAARAGGFVLSSLVW